MVFPVDPARLRHGLSPLTTSSLPHHVTNHLGTPISAVSMASSHMLSAHTTIQPYNPQEWISPPPALTPPPNSEAVSRHDSQAVAPPPPPYSPPRSRRQRPASTAFEFYTESTSPQNQNARANVMLNSRPSPEPQVACGLPPPPPDATRGASRDRRFGLPPSARRRDADHLPSLLDPLPSERIPGTSTVPPGSERVAAAPPVGIPVAPPSARRAASTGALENPSSARTRSDWEHPIPLPPPPPGPPPPSGMRSQSLQSVDRNCIPFAAPPTRRPPPRGVSSLGPVPPTPANWIDEDAESGLPDRSRAQDIIEPQTLASSNEGVDSLASSPNTSGLNRACATRRDKTIIQRRAESRHRNPASPHRSIDTTPRPHQISDIMVSTDAIRYAPAAIGSNPQSSGSVPQSIPFRAGEPSSSSPRAQVPRNLTLRPPCAARLPRLDTATPPLPLHPAKASQSLDDSGSVAPRALPTPPPQTRSASSSRRRDGARLSSDKTSASQHQVLTQSPEQFAADAIERFRAFAEREAAAPLDAERVRLFADFIVSESRIRRERYSTAIGAMGSEILDLTRNLFRPMPTDQTGHTRVVSRSEWTPASSAGPNASPMEDLAGGSSFGLCSSAPASADLPVTPSDDWTPNNVNRATNYMPSLSPILSMSISENYEKGSSRGRPPSRWWESGSQGEQSRVLERSRRESKYMGVPKNQWVEGEQDPAARRDPGIPSDGQSSGDCPPEKVGWHTFQSEPRTPSVSAAGSTKLRVSSREPESLDVSRLVTLPPPYPRHHPAVNNNHPELATTRSSVRSLSDLAGIDLSKERFAEASARRRDEFAQAASERQKCLRANLQKEIVAGNLSYADAAAIEADSQEQENAKEKELEKAEYEHFQNEVVLPLNDLLTGRIARTTESFDDLSRHLFDNGQMDADMPQEEGDDRPELLEKLTLLKWIFETRETLHRAIFDIISERNRRYREVVVAPYKLSGNVDKLKLAEEFFAEDAGKRAHAYANETLERARALQTAVEEAVERGVALQLSAFWDIAPPLRQLLDGIPDDVGVFGVQIPASELAENPSYHEHPLQYLYSLLQHAEKSTYQFIESHANLLCLLHEVKEAVVNAAGRVLATRTDTVGEATLENDEGGRVASAMRDSESSRLTDDLREKVRLVQEQWDTALGDGIKNVKERIGAWLLQHGGWDETLEESAVFGPM